MEQRLIDAAYGYQQSWFSYSIKQFIQNKLLIQLYRLAGSRRFRVFYPDGLVSTTGTYTFAKDYAAIFNGTVVLDRKRK